MASSIQNKNSIYQKEIEMQIISTKVSGAQSSSNGFTQKIIDCSKLPFEFLRSSGSSHNPRVDQPPAEPQSRLVRNANSEDLLRQNPVFSNSCRINKNPKAANPGPIMVVLQSEAAFTIATDRKPILATYGCGSCIAIGGFEAKNKMAFLIHVAFSKELAASGGIILSTIAKFMTKRIDSPIQIHLRGGIKGLSEKTERYIKNTWMKTRADLPMRLASEDILSEYRNSSKSLFIDSSTGKVGKYDPRKDPFTREITNEDYQAALNSPGNPKITIAYDCKIDLLRN